MCKITLIDKSVVYGNESNPSKSFFDAQKYAIQQEFQNMNNRCTEIYKWRLMNELFSKGISALL